MAVEAVVLSLKVLTMLSMEFLSTQVMRPTPNKVALKILPKSKVKANRRKTPRRKRRSATRTKTTTTGELL